MELCLLEGGIRPSGRGGNLGFRVWGFVLCVMGLGSWGFKDLGLMGLGSRVVGLRDVGFGFENETLKN